MVRGSWRPSPAGAAARGAPRRRALGELEDRTVPASASVCSVARSPSSSRPSTSVQPRLKARTRSTSSGIVRPLLRQLVDSVHDMPRGVRLSTGANRCGQADAARSMRWAPTSVSPAATGCSSHRSATPAWKAWKAGTAARETDASAPSSSIHDVDERHTVIEAEGGVGEARGPQLAELGEDPLDQLLVLVRGLGLGPVADHSGADMPASSRVSCFVRRTWRGAHRTSWHRPVDANVLRASPAGRQGVGARPSCCMRSIASLRVDTPSLR